jgi:hypothetical protein
VERTPEHDAAIDDIRRRMRGGCGADEFAAMRCPVCGNGIDLHVHPRGQMYSVRCRTSTGHMGFHDSTPAAPEWWSAHRDGPGTWLA